MDHFDFAPSDALLDFATGFVGPDEPPSSTQYPTSYVYSIPQQQPHTSHFQQNSSWPAPANLERAMDPYDSMSNAHQRMPQHSTANQPQNYPATTSPNSSQVPQPQYSSRPSSGHSDQALSLQTSGLEFDYGMLPTNWQYQMQQQALAQQQARQEQQRQQQQQHNRERQQQLQQQAQQQQQQHHAHQSHGMPLPHAHGNNMNMNAAYGAFGNLQASPIDFVPSTHADNFVVSNAMGPAGFMSMAGPMDSMNALAFPLTDYQNETHTFAMAQNQLMLNQHTLDQLSQQVAAHSVHSSPSGGSPTGTILEVQSLSDNEWSMVNYSRNRNSIDSYSGTVSNPSQNLHIRTNSDSSSSDAADSSELSGSYEEVPPWPMTSPHDFHGSEYLTAQYIHQHQERLQQPQQPNSSPVSSTAVSPIAVSYRGQSSSSSPTSSGPRSPPVRRRKASVVDTKTTKSAIKKPTNTTRKDIAAEKKVGKRHGPLSLEQRAQAHEIRKRRACLRCKFLKKTCDTGDPCAGCKPSHARLWQVPCTRLDIKDIGYFMKDWKVDYERHVSLGFSVGNIKSYGSKEWTIYITHGYGICLPLQARQVFTHNDGCFSMDWVEGCADDAKSFEVQTLKLAAGVEGVSTSVLSEYLEQHIDQGFEYFVDNFFEGTKFVTEILKTAHSYYQKEQTPSIRKALKLVLAYNLTQHITMVEGLAEEDAFVGRVDDDNSKFFGKTFAPVMINFQIKCALAEIWRELQKEILEELSSLYSSIYSKDKLKNWPTIFIIASLLLLIWEEMQFDCHYKEPNDAVIHKFCDDMESTPVGVIVGLFQAISTKLPSIQEWDTKKHHQLLNSNSSICDALTEVRGHVNKYEGYLKERATSTQFDRDDLDSLSGKFLSKLVIRAN